MVTQWFDTSTKKVEGVSEKSFKFKFFLKLRYMFSCTVSKVSQPFVNHLWAL